MPYVRLSLAAFLMAAVPATWRLVLSEAGSPPGEDGAEIRGQVVGEAGPLAGATVGIKGRRERVKTDDRGEFTLPVPRGSAPRVVASRPGYFIAGGDWPGSGSLTIRLRPHAPDDCPKYQWVDPRPDPERQQQCGNCHGQIFGEWSASPHGRSAANRRFLNLYEGTDWRGNEDIGWSLLAEFPEGGGVCSSCHVPSLEPAQAASADLRKTSGTHRQGIHCDFCHKIAGVSLQQVGLDHGRFAMRLIRPPDGRQIFFGSLDDEDRGRSAFLPLYRESRYCASCHEGIIFGTHAYSEYSEWRASRYAEQAVQCQDCHMAPTGRMKNVAPGHGGIDRDPHTLASHASRRGDADGLRSHVSLSVATRKSAAGFEVFTTVQTHGIGHRTPTGYPSRQLILWVRATDAQGKPLQRLAGPVLPALAGRGPTDQGGLAGQPGWMYAKVLEGLNGEQPVPYWRANRLKYDTRLQPDEPDHRRFLFRRPPGGVQVVAQLIYRRFSKYLADQKGWPDNEFVVLRRQIALPEDK